MSHDRITDRYPVIEHAEGRHRPKSGLERFVAVVVVAAVSALMIFVLLPGTGPFRNMHSNPDAGRPLVVTAPTQPAPSSERFVMPREGCPPGTPRGTLVTVNPDGSVDCDPSDRLKREPSRGGR